MRCKECDYRLWNLTANRCPECGTPFLPSEFEFTLGSVQFCCPHCGQTYYGEGERGHLAPSEFDCASCGMHVQMDEMVLRPADGVDEIQTRVEHAPWLERSERGFIRAWFATVGLAMVNPPKLMRGTPRDSSAASAWGFALLTNAVAFGSTALFMSLVFLAMMLFWGMGGGAPDVMAGAFMLIPAFVGFVVHMLVLVLWGPVTQGLLRLTNRRRTRLERMGRTYQALCYASGANVITALPCLGVYIGWLWWAISAVFTVRQVHGIRGGAGGFLRADLAPPAGAHVRRRVRGLHLVRGESHEHDGRSDGDHGDEERDATGARWDPRLRRRASGLGARPRTGSGR